MASSVRSPPGDRNDAQPAGAVSSMSRARHARRSWVRRGSRGTAVFYAGAVHLGLITVVVSEYDPAIGFFVDGLGFELVEDSPALTGDGRPKRWVVVRPPGAVTGLLLARADGQDQVAPSGSKLPGGWVSSSRPGTSTLRIRGWHLRACSSSPRRAPNPTAMSLYSPTLLATNGTLSARDVKALARACSRNGIAGMGFQQ